jgi:enoyl-CoA hydratase
MALETFADPAFAPNDRTPEGRAAIIDTLAQLQSTFNKIEALRMPVICAIQGACVGGGLDLVATACIRYASAESFFCVQEINIGMTADLGSLQRLPKLMPLGIVKELAYTGRRMTAQEAASHGLVNAVYDTPEATVTAALACARNCGQAARGHLGQQAGDQLRARPQRERLAAANGLGAERHLEQPPCHGGRECHAGQARRRLPPLEPLQAFAPALPQAGDRS